MLSLIPKKGQATPAKSTLLCGSELASKPPVNNTSPAAVPNGSKTELGPGPEPEPDPRPEPEPKPKPEPEPELEPEPDPEPEVEPGYKPKNEFQTIIIA